MMDEDKPNIEVSVRKVLDMWEVSRVGEYNRLKVKRYRQFV